jgi:hypothetical protein
MEFVTPQDVRDYLRMDGVDGDDLRYGDRQLGSNIRAASSFLQRTTRRQFEPQTATTKRFTSNGRVVVPIPDLRAATSVTLQDAPLDASETYWLIPDPIAPEVYTGVQVRAFGGNYRANPQWFDRNLDRDWRRGLYTTSLPGDLVIVGNWGHDPYPEDLLMATKVLAAWYTKRPEAVLANVRITPEGSELQYGEMPPEVTHFLGTWTLAEQMVVAG